MTSTRPRVTTIVGGHDYDESALAGCIDGAIVDLGEWLDAGAPPSDVVVFYTMHSEDPGAGGVQRMSAALDGLDRAGSGILVLHHAIFAFPGWARWSDVVGIVDRTVGPVDFAQRLRIRIADPGHPVTAGLADWEMTDETYLMAEPESRHRVLLATDHPRSMRAIAWAHERRRSRVLSLQSGHDATSLGHPALRAFVGRGIDWLAAERTS